MALTEEFAVTKGNTCVRGYLDLVELWGQLPVSVLRFSPTPQPDLHQLSDDLRARAWREHCQARDMFCCVEAGSSQTHCRMIEQGGCRADRLFPGYFSGGGAPKWRMATLFLHWWPSNQLPWLIALGETACAEIGWSLRRLTLKANWATPQTMPISCLGDLFLRESRRWRLTFVTPWIVSKDTLRENNAARILDEQMVVRELIKSMRVRAHKLTALCLQDPLQQRLAAHLVHYVADSLPASAFVVENLQITTGQMALSSTGNGQKYKQSVLEGEIILNVEPSFLPLLSLIALCGGGENPDKGNGRVELLPLDSGNTTKSVGERI